MLAEVLAISDTWQDAYFLLSVYLHTRAMPAWLVPRTGMWQCVLLAATLARPNVTSVFCAVCATV